MVISSERLAVYFNSLNDTAIKEYEIASKARAKGLDTSTQVDVKLAKNLAERVVGLISVVCPQIIGSGVVERIIDLEKQFGTLDWRVAMTIANELAQMKFVQFPTKKEAIEIGIRVGFAYVTVGVVSSPLEGFTGIDIKKRRDGGEYFCMNFAGPVRNAGGTAAAVSVLIADYVRSQLGYQKYDADEKEQERAYTEIMDYHEKVTNLQYVPSKNEILFLMQNIPIEVGGDASEKFDVSNFKDLPRIKQNRIRSGVCLINSSCIPLKAPKIWKNLSKWIDAMQMTDWKFLEEFLQIQKKAKSHGATSSASNSAAVYPIYTYMEDLVGGRPVIGHPLRPGGLRLRYGRSRVSGFSAQSIHPATMAVLDSFVATATQFKVERPGKAAAFTSCDHLSGPVVLLEDGSVEYLDTTARAKQVTHRITKILYLGDVLICYGDFFDRAHTLMPPGYCEEWWILEFEKAAIAKHTTLDIDAIATAADSNKELVTKIFADPIMTKIEPDLAIKISQTYNIPLHPMFTPFYKLANKEDLYALISGIINAKQSATGELIITYTPQIKAVLEKLAIPHKKMPTDIILPSQWATVFSLQFGADSNALLTKALTILPTATDGLDFINQLSKVAIQDKAGIFIGARMGRPEKAKMRKMAGFPYSIEPQVRENPDRTKFVITEHAGKGAIRQKYDIQVNKDGTIRYDASEVPITHFKPKEIGAPIDKLKTLGYTHDIHNQPLTDDNQILELFAQDIIIPCCLDSPNEPSDDILVRVANFVDDELVKLYELPPYYNVSKREDLIGHLVFGLAPHTSAASLGRIIGFSKTQGMFCHPMFHAAMRRDCDGDESCFFLLMDGFLNFSTAYLPRHRGGTMDAPLVLTSIINPSEVDDMYQNLDIVWKYPLEFYEAAIATKKPWDVKIKLAGSTLNKPEQFEGLGFTHDTTDFNEGVTCSAYKTLPSMKDKLDGQMRLAEKIDAVDEADVASIVIKKHFLRDIKGNMRTFSQQEFRCIKCNTKYRRPPIIGKCTKCGLTKIVFTVNQASVVKYLEMSINLAKKYNISPYTKQALDVLRVQADGMFGKETEKQTGLSGWM